MGPTNIVQEGKNHKDQQHWDWVPSTESWTPDGCAKWRDNAMSLVCQREKQSEWERVRLKQSGREVKNEKKKRILKQNEQTVK